MEPTAISTLYNVVLAVLKNPASKSMSALGEAFVADLIVRAALPKVTNVVEIEGKPTFKGYPSGDFVYQVAFHQTA